MESLRENKALLYSLSGTGAFIFILAIGWIPELSEQFGIIDFPPEVTIWINFVFLVKMMVSHLFFNFQFRQMLLRVLAIDFFMSLIMDRLCLILFGEGKLRNL